MPERRTVPPAAAAHLKPLWQFLVDAFSAPEFERFLLFNGYEDVLRKAVKTDGDARFFNTALRHLHRDRRIDSTFFARLSEDRPASAERIAVLASEFLPPPEP